MKRSHLVLAVLSCGLLLGGCKSTSQQPAGKKAGAKPAATKPASGTAVKGELRFAAKLSGRNEKPPVETDATGQADLTVAPDGKSIHYTVTVAKLKDAMMAHLHLAPKGEIVVWLYPPGGTEPKTIEGVTNGTLVEGTIKADDLVGPMKGKTIADLVSKIKAGDIYVQVHTKAHPEGELTGTLKGG